MSTRLENLSPEEMESLAALLVAELEGSGKAPHRFSDGYGAETSRPDSGEEDEAPRRQLSSFETELIREVVREVREAEDSFSFRASLTRDEQEFIAPFTAGPDASEKRKKRLFSDSAPAAKPLPAPADYSEVTGESGIEMDRLSRFFDRDSRRYDGAFERY